MEAKTQFTEDAAVKIGETVTTMLREYTSDIEKAIADAEAATEEATVKVPLSFKVTLETNNHLIFPKIDIKFATGKKVADSANVDLKQTEMPV